MVWTATADLPDEFFAKVVEMCTLLGCAPLDLLGVATYESGVRAAAHNPNGDASGLWQLMPSSARGLGWNVTADPHLDAFRTLGPVGQLPWFQKYFLPYRGRLVSSGACYVAVFLPALLAHAGDPNFILCGASGPLAWAYKANTNFDMAKTGVIRVSDLEAAIERARKNLGNRWLEIAERVDAAVGATQPVADAAPPFVLAT